MGLALSNIMNINSGKGRAILTLIGTIIATIIALLGILDYFTDFLLMTALIYPAIAGVMMTDFFFIRNQKWKDIDGWNWMATIAMVAGTAIGYVTQYVKPMGLPAVQSLILSGIVYYIAMKIKASLAPDKFTEFSTRTRDQFEHPTEIGK